MSVVLSSWGEQLQDVQNAIKAVNQSQRYEINGRMMQKADLEWLHKREVYLNSQYLKFGDTIINPTKIKRGLYQVNFV